MALKQELELELNRLAAVGGGRLEVDLPHGRLTAEVLAVDAIGCSVDGVSFATPKLANVGVPQLKKISDELTRRLTYLLEPIGLIETDQDSATVQMRSNPPQKDDDGTQYYELLVRRGGDLTLLRYQKISGQPRQTIGAHLTREVFSRLAGDLTGVISP